MKITVFGASGFVGSALLPLLSATHRVVAVSRSAHEDSPGVEWVVGDAASPEDVARATKDAEVVYYLVHSLGSDDFERRDRQAADNVARACEQAGVRQIIYLGGLGDQAPDASPASP